MTSLIDVIFLLLLFFMLSSTFSKFSEVELSAAADGAVEARDIPPLFLQLRADDVRLNGDAMPLEGLSAALKGRPKGAAPQSLLIAMRDGITSQRLTDLLVVLRSVPGIAPTVLDGG